MILRLQTLKPVPAQFRTGRRFREDELIILDQDYGFTGAEDKYHVKIRTVSNYASMDDIKTYVKQSRPDLDMSIWSMCPLYGGSARVSVCKESIYVPADIMNTLKKDHEHSSVYICSVNDWQMELSRDERIWLEDVIPCYVDMTKIKKLLSRRLYHIGAKEENELAYKTEEYVESSLYNHDIFGFLCSAQAYARCKRLALYATLEN